MKISKEKLTKAIEGSGGIVTLIAKRMDVSRIALYKHLQKHPEFNELIDNARAQLIDVAETKLLTKVDNGDDWAVKYVLGTLGKGRGWTERSEQVIEHTGEGLKLIIEERVNENTKSNAK